MADSNRALRLISGSLWVVVLAGWLVLMVAVVDTVRWLFGAEQWLSLPVLNAATAVVIVSEVIKRLKGRGLGLRSPENRVP